MDVAGTCSHKATRDFIVSTLELKPKITNNLGPSFTLPFPRLLGEVHYSVTKTFPMTESTIDLACVYSPIVVSDRSSEHGGILL